jgi:hypothetical protein
MHQSDAAIDGLRTRHLRKAINHRVDPFVKGRVSSWINTTTLELCGLRAPDEILWRGSRFTRDPYVGDEANNETDLISRAC